MDKIKECINCGAQISAEDAECPYCHYMQYDAAEAQYMDTLETMNESMGNLDKNTRRITRSSITKSMLLTLAAAAICIALGTLTGIAVEKADSYYYENSSKIVREFDWYDAHMPDIRQAYDAKDFERIYELLNSDDKISYYNVLHNWEHYSLYQLYTRAYYRFGRDIKETDNMNEVDEITFAALYRSAIETLEAEYRPDSTAASLYAECSDEDKRIADGWFADVRHFLIDYAGLTEEQCREDFNALYADNGYISYSSASEYAKRYYAARGGAQ